MTTPDQTYPTITVQGVTISPTVLHQPEAGRTGRARAGWVVSLTIGDGVVTFRDEHRTLTEARDTAAEVAAAWATAKHQIAVITGDTATYPAPSTASGGSDSAAGTSDGDDDSE